MTTGYDFLSESPQETEAGKVFNFLTPSESARFYDEFYGGHTSSRPELYAETKKKHREEGSAYRIMEEIMVLLQRNLPDDALVIELGGGMHQQRSGNAYRIFPNYFPLDIGLSNIRNYCKKYDRMGFVADAMRLPFKNESIDCILTHTFLEHPLQPEKVVAEIVRVLKPGGLVVHNDAWFCRWWHRFGVVGLKSPAHMSAKEKFIWLSSKITEFPLIRIPPIITRRLFTWILSPHPKNAPFRYHKLKPNYSLHLGCDEDAASAIDPVDVIRYYESRGFSLLQPLTFKERLFFPNRFIALRKRKPMVNTDG